MANRPLILKEFGSLGSPMVSLSGWVSLSDLRQEIGIFQALEKATVSITVSMPEILYTSRIFGGITEADCRHECFVSFENAKSFQGCVFGTGHPEKGVPAPIDQPHGQGKHPFRRSIPTHFGVMRGSTAMAALSGSSSR